MQADACPACRRYRTSTHMLVSLHTEPYSLTEHHGRTASSSASTSMRVNMVHLSAASDGGERGRVVVDDDSRARPRTVWHLTRDMGDDMSPGCHASPCERQEAHTLPNVLYLLWAATTSYEDANWIPARVRTRRVQESSSLAMAMPPTAVRGTKPSVACARESDAFT